MEELENGCLHGGTGSSQAHYCRHCGLLFHLKENLGGCTISCGFTRWPAVWEGHSMLEGEVQELSLNKLGRTMESLQCAAVF